MTTVFQPVSWGDPFRDLRRFQDDLNRLFTAWPSPRAREFPPLNLWANEAGIVVAAELPGIPAEQISVSVHENTLTLSGRRPPVVPDEKAAALREELAHGAFSRTVVLPFVVDAANVSARSEDGVLVVHLPRPEADRPKRIRIATA
jgi:HSP20 family protein